VREVRWRVVDLDAGEIAPPIAAERPAIAVKRWVVVVLTSDSFVSVPGGVSGDVDNLGIDVVSAHHTMM
jgi:hypothetical protein